jgi:hypothetical protein
MCTAFQKNSARPIETVNVHFACLSVSLHCVWFRLRILFNPQLLSAPNQPKSVEFCFRSNPLKNYETVLILFGAAYSKLLCAMFASVLNLYRMPVSFFVSLFFTITPSVFALLSSGRKGGGGDLQKSPKLIMPRYHSWISMIPWGSIVFAWLWNNLPLQILNLHRSAYTFLTESRSVLYDPDPIQTDFFMKYFLSIWPSLAKYLRIFSHYKS